jgi:DNA (cytosine-5)-methyltransferase 1
LAGMGYRTTWGIFSASEVGAPHQRKRVFILAHRCDKGLQGREWFRETGTEGTPSRHASQCNGSMAVASGLGGAAGLSGSVPRHERQSGEPDHGGGQDVGNAISQGVEGPHNNGSISEGVQPDSIKSSAWPSRPGEQQYGWEPPRVVGDTGCERQEERQVEAGGSEQSDEVRDVADSSVSGSDGRSDGSCRWSRESGEAGVDAAGCGSEGNGMRQAEPPLGGDPDGPPSGLDYAELCVTCDNRTDELRLLGNGVVPHTAELAFRVLIQELANE